MFFGTIPPILAQYIEQELERKKPKRILVPFAGNFVMEQIARIALPESEIHSTDVSIYSRAIGFGLTDQDFRLELKAETAEDFPFLAEKKLPLEKAAVAIIALELAKIIKKKEKIAYYRNLYHDAVNHQRIYFDQVYGKLAALRSSLKMSFYGIDGVLFLEMAGPGDAVLFDPPVSENNSDYEKEYSCLNDVVDFDEVPYTRLDNEKKLSLLEQLHAKRVLIYYRTNNKKADLPQYLKQCFSYKYKWNGEYCLYSNAESMLWVGSWSPIREQVVNLPVIDKSDVITEESRIEVVPVSNDIGNHYRIMWIKKAQMLDSGDAYLVMIDGKVVGMFQLAPGLKFGTELIVINSDPAAPTSRYKRLSKLILHILCTNETMKYVNEKTLWPHIGFTTRVFSNSPSSMKYRGLFELTERVEDNGSDYKYKLIYQNKKNIFRTRREALAEWLKKYGDKQED